MQPFWANKAESKQPHVCKCVSALRLRQYLGRLHSPWAVGRWGNQSRWDICGSVRGGLSVACWRGRWQQISPRCGRKHAKNSWSGMLCDCHPARSGLRLEQQRNVIHSFVHPSAHCLFLVIILQFLYSC